MYVCICNGITDKTIREAAQRGVRNLSELTMSTGVASCCGRCADHAEAVLRETQVESSGFELNVSFA